jgi:creatinine amidohydrolase
LSRTGITIPRLNSNVVPVHSLASLTWPAVRGLPAGRTVAVLPTGAIEAHGPHLPFGTDVIIAEAMARAGAERLSAHGFHVLLLPALTMAPAPFATEFAGTMDVPATATTTVVTGVVRSLAAGGIRVAAIANAHHDPVHVDALRRAVGEISATSSDVVVVFPDLTRRRLAERLTSEFRSGACHAGRYESSIVLAERPDLVRADVMAALAPNPRSLVDAIRRGDTTFTAAGGPDGYFGFPADATAEEGHAIVEELGAILYDAVVDALAPTGAES